ncbi:hypothetical protein GQ55_6G009800 [Panicum hallii var. hallii]|uniref:Uncharacterized protein n=1 Tax=Panicum hallii var. hallii TaxID=1504633 RepID=A0A2T7D2J6_9POAL|nr:hypothetical protein GQ55_6G009800 [Panicum hallii var. hallii]
MPPSPNRQSGGWPPPIGSNPAVRCSPVGASCHQPDPPSSGPDGGHKMGRRRLPFFQIGISGISPNPPRFGFRARERVTGRDGRRSRPRAIPLPLRDPRPGAQDAGRGALPPPLLLRRLPPRPRAGRRCDGRPPRAEHARGVTEACAAAGPGGHQHRRPGALRLCRGPALPPRRGAPPRAADPAVHVAAAHRGARRQRQGAAHEGGGRRGHLRHPGRRPLRPDPGLLRRHTRAEAARAHGELGTGDYHSREDHLRQHLHNYRGLTLHS